MFTENEVEEIRTTAAKSPVTHYDSHQQGKNQVLKEEELVKELIKDALYSNDAFKPNFVFNLKVMSSFTSLRLHIK